MGNLVCPSSYDLGENLRFVLLSVIEGEDKPLKYPTIFNSADVAIVTKIELAEGSAVDWAAAQKSIQSVRPGMQVFRLSAKTGRGIEEYLSFLAEQLAELRTKVQVWSFPLPGTEARCGARRTIFRAEVPTHPVRKPPKLNPGDATMPSDRAGTLFEGWILNLWR